MIYAGLYLGSIMVANLLVHWFGIINLGFIQFPAGAVFVGLTFSFRDMVQKRYGKWWCWVWMLLACVITYFFNRDLALASVIAFLASESIDWLVFTFTKGSFNQRLILSNIIGIPIDSIIFVSIAFGFILPAIIGQTIVKILSSLLVVFFKHR